MPPNSHTIYVKGDKTGPLTYTDQTGAPAKSKRMFHKDLVSWSASDLSGTPVSIKVEFRQGSPFAQRSISSQGAIPTAQVQAKGNAATRLYKYYVSLGNGAKEDPDIIIDPDAGFVIVNAYATATGPHELAVSFTQSRPVVEGDRVKWVLHYSGSAPVTRFQIDFSRSEQGSPFVPDFTRRRPIESRPRTLETAWLKTAVTRSLLPQVYPYTLGIPELDSTFTKARLEVFPTFGKAAKKPIKKTAARQAAKKNK